MFESSGFHRFYSGWLDHLPRNRTHTVSAQFTSSVQQTFPERKDSLPIQKEHVSQPTHCLVVHTEMQRQTGRSAYKHTDADTAITVDTDWFSTAFTSPRGCRDRLTYGATHRHANTVTCRHRWVHTAASHPYKHEMTQLWLPWKHSQAF